MTTAQKRLVGMVPQMPAMIPKLSEDKVQQIINIFVTVQEPVYKTQQEIDDQRAIDDLMEMYGCVSLPDDFDDVEAKETYLREKVTVPYDRTVTQ